MLTGVTLELALVITAAFLFVCVFASKVSAKLGIPALIFFLGVGMLAGSDGPGGIAFSDMNTTKALGTIALAFILFAGGLDTAWSAIKPVFWRATSLATLGVVVSATLVGLFAHYVLALPLLVSLLLGTIVSCTDAAAVFAVLRSSGIRLKHNITPTLELESGANDPIAIFLTLGISSLMTHPDTSPLSLIPHFLLEMPLGAAVGLIGGYGAVIIINRVRLEYDGLYPVITIATVCFSFGCAYLTKGNPFLAVYVAGVTMGSRNFLHRLTLIQFHDAIAWLMQIVMFVMLGLLVFPSQLVKVTGPGLVLSIFLILVARPVAVFASLILTKIQKRTKLFIAWAGLRGAVPIILATFPALAGVPEAPLIFNLVFFIVVTSVLIQGTTLRSLARLLSVAVPQRSPTPDLKQAGEGDLLEVRIETGSRSSGMQVVDLRLPSTALIVLLRRGGESYIPRGSTVLEAGDELLVATRREDHDELRKRFS